MSEKSCPFCNTDETLIAENEHCFAMPDQYPASPGHTLIISRRHVKDFFDLNEEEKAACFELLQEMKEKLQEEHEPDGWNIGMNCGSVAGQTVFHFHCHLIPRYKGDMDDPSGGVRHSVRGKGYY
jgi:diadenosine tetraphosphate (Ap4A) HIT family hydrolase